MTTRAFAIEFRDPAAGAWRRVGFAPDWEPAIEGALFTRFVTTGSWAARAPTAIVPLWDARHGPPVIDRFHVEVDGASCAAELLAHDYFAEVARRRWAESHGAPTAAAVEFRIVAEDLPASDQPAPAFTMADVPTAPVVRDVTLDRPDRPEFDAVLPPQALREITALTDGAGDVETGGALIGFLGRDPSRCRAASVVTAQLQAEHAVTAESSLSFTSETWTAFRAALATRGLGEQLLGWWHSHPAHAWCRKCADEAQASCRLAQGFLSADDQLLHRTVFPRAYTLALVMTRTARHTRPALFGWQAGVLRPRDFVTVEAHSILGARTCPVA